MKQKQELFKYFLKYGYNSLGLIEHSYVANF